jgi:glutamyl-tRNA synthetase
MFNFLKKKKVVTRFAPSPTGVLHIGGVRTALFNYLYARKHGGKFILRIEDTDKERSKKEYEDGILESFAWIGLEHDEFYRQSDRGDIYKKFLQQLLDNGLAYEGEENKDGTGKVIRFKNSNIDITFKDEIVGEVTFNTTELEDFVIARDINSPVYHFVVVVDDGDMGITHVIRGQEHLNSTARQILILEALGFDRPTYAHIPLIMSPNGGKLSKRDPGVKSVMEYKNEGYLKAGLINFLAFIGWNPGDDDKEILTLKELIKEFSLERVQKSGAAFNPKKLQWTNRQHIQKLNKEELREYVQNFVSPDLYAQIEAGKTDAIITILTERIESFGELREQETAGAFDYLFDQPTYEAGNLIPKKSMQEETLTHLKHVASTLSDLNSFTKESIKESLWDYATEKGRGNVLWPLRYALSGKDRSPDPFSIAEILEKEETLSRVNHAIKLLS